MPRTNGRAYALLVFLFVVVVAVLFFVFLGTHVDTPPLLPNTTTAGASVAVAPPTDAGLPPVRPPSPRVRRAWVADSILLNATATCGYDRIQAINGGDDACDTHAQAMPVWLGAQPLFLAGVWATDGAALLVWGNQILPVTICGGGDRWERVSDVVAAGFAFVARVTAYDGAALYLWPSNTTLALAEPEERPSQLRFTGSRWELYSWSATQGTVYLRESHDGHTWSSVRVLLAVDAIEPRVIDTGGGLVLAALQPSTGNVRFLLRTRIDWAPSATRTLLLQGGNTVDTLTGAYRNMSHRLRVVHDHLGELHVLGADQRSAHTLLVSARSCLANDTYPGCQAYTPEEGCTPNPLALASACLRLATPRLHLFHAVSRNDALTAEFLGKTDETESALADVLLLQDGRLVVAYYRMSVSLRRLEIHVLVGELDLLVDTIDGTALAASRGGAAYDAPALRGGEDGLYLAYSRPTPVVDTRESHMTVVFIDTR